MNYVGIDVALAQADVIVTNPTELAVAIQYDPTTMAAPIVVAKGAGVLAQRDAARRPRKALREFVLSAWGQPAQLS